jgi:anthranilate synthase component 2
MKILIIDNFDSFTFNLYQYCGEILDKKFKNNFNEIIVKRNNQLTLDDISKINPNRIIISPGPGSPEQKKYFGICEDIILKFGPSIPLLGICLGMQGIAHAFGAKIIQAKKPMHGKTSFLVHDRNGLHKNIPQNIEIMRYHSLIVDPKTLPDCFFVNAISKDEENNNITPDFTNLHSKNDIMSIKHKKYPIFGIQYHPESFGTEGGMEVLGNFLT